MVQLVIEKTWDAEPIGPEEQVTLDLSAADHERLRIRVRAPFYGDVAPAGPPRSTMGLWEHEVVELFVLGAGDASDAGEAGGPPEAPPVYTEIELGPHGHYLILQLRGVRQVVPKLLARPLPLDYEASLGSADGGDFWLGEALLDRALLPPPPHRINAYAIHGHGANRRHLALYPVPGDEPDFHRLACFREMTLPGD
jgi:hypothetical protein